MRIDLGRLDFIDENLKLIAIEIEEEFGEKTITSLYRINDPGVHGQLPLRGLDLRCRSSKHGYEIETFINNKWEYDYKRPEKDCCFFHNSGNGYHLHLQTHPNTRRKDEY